MNLDVLTGCAVAFTILFGVFAMTYVFNTLPLQKMEDDLKKRAMVKKAKRRAEEEAFFKALMAEER